MPQGTSRRRAGPSASPPNHYHMSPHGNNPPQAMEVTIYLVWERRKMKRARHQGAGPAEVKETAGSYMPASEYLPSLKTYQT
jgi:hypothetical protein